MVVRGAEQEGEKRPSEASQERNGLLEERIVRDPSVDLFPVEVFLKIRALKAEPAMGRGRRTETQ